MGGGSGENSGASGLAGGATLERPGTTQRSGGRVAMTVLRPRQPAAAQPEQQPATALPPLALSQQAQATLPTTLAAPRRSLLGVKQVCAVLPGLSLCTMFAYQLS